MRLQDFCRVAALVALVAAILTGVIPAASAQAAVISFEAQYQEVPAGNQDAQGPNPQGDAFLVRFTSDTAGVYITQIRITLPANTVFDTATSAAADIGDGTDLFFQYGNESGPTSSPTPTPADGSSVLDILFADSVFTDSAGDFEFEIDVDNTTPAGTSNPNIHDRREVAGDEFAGATIEIWFGLNGQSPQSSGPFNFIPGSLLTTDPQDPDNPNQFAHARSGDFQLAFQQDPTPVPEPTSLALWAVSGLGMAYAARRRRNRAARGN
ncbi:MAG: PEP-CTERM sorting domain-containing protein [Planctomycetaceae bacterium]